MNINDIVARDLAQEERKQREKIAQTIWTSGRTKPSDVREWLVVAAVVAIVTIAALGCAFAAGIWWESRRALEADRAFTAWLDKVEQ